jgi:hypothetical protein
VADPASLLSCPALKGAPTLSERRHHLLHHRRRASYLSTASPDSDTSSSTRGWRRRLHYQAAVGKAVAPPYPPSNDGRGNGSRPWRAPLPWNAPQQIHPLASMGSVSPSCGKVATALSSIAPRSLLKILEELHFIPRLPACSSPPRSRVLITQKSRHLPAPTAIHIPISSPSLRHHLPSHAISSTASPTAIVISRQLERGPIRALRQARLTRPLPHRCRADLYGAGCGGDAGSGTGVGGWWLWH